MQQDWSWRRRRGSVKNEGGRVWFRNGGKRKGSKDRINESVEQSDLMLTSQGDGTKTLNFKIIQSMYLSDPAMS